MVFPEQLYAVVMRLRVLESFKDNFLKLVLHKMCMFPSVMKNSGLVVGRIHRHKQSGNGALDGA